MAHPGDVGIPLDGLPTPCYVIDRELLERNVALLGRVQTESGAKILLALKAFSMFRAFPYIRPVLCGTTASSLNEARLAAEEFGKEVHLYAVAYSPAEIGDYLRLAHSITFNSFTQWRRFRDQALAARPAVSCGIRINPEYSEVKTLLYNPCRPGSRFGMTAAQFEGERMDGIEGLHFHTMCEQNSDTLERTLDAVESKFGPLLPRMKWLNMGGGHHITRPDYDVERLIRLVRRTRERYGVEVYLEPGEAVALHTGYLVASVLDVFRRDGRSIAILDASATAHMPDVLEMPYRPEIVAAGEPGRKPHDVTLGGNTCLSGDVIGDYSFDAPLEPGDRLIFTDMAHYSMVKNNTFNGVNLPAIAVYHRDRQEMELVRQFGYEDYKSRLS